MARSSWKSKWKRTLKRSHKLATRRYEALLLASRSMRDGNKVRSMLIERGWCKRYGLWIKGRLDKDQVPWWFCELTMRSHVEMKGYLRLDPLGRKSKEQVHVHLEGGASELSDEMKRTETYNVS